MLLTRSDDGHIDQDVQPNLGITIRCVNSVVTSTYLPVCERSPNVSKRKIFGFSNRRIVVLWRDMFSAEV